MTIALHFLWRVNASGRRTVASASVISLWHAGPSSDRRKGVGEIASGFGLEGSHLRDDISSYKVWGIRADTGELPIPN
jgi:hypothetical protein